MEWADIPCGVTFDDASDSLCYAESLVSALALVGPIHAWLGAVLHACPRDGERNEVHTGALTALLHDMRRATTTSATATLHAALTFRPHMLLLTGVEGAQEDAAELLDHIVAAGEGVGGGVTCPARITVLTLHECVQCHTVWTTSSPHSYIELLREENALLSEQLWASALVRIPCSACIDRRRGQGALSASLVRVTRRLDGPLPPVLAIALSRDDNKGVCQRVPLHHHLPATSLPLGMPHDDPTNSYELVAGVFHTTGDGGVTGHYEPFGRVVHLPWHHVSALARSYPWRLGRKLVSSGELGDETVRGGRNMRGNASFRLLFYVRSDVLDMPAVTSRLVPDAYGGGHTTRMSIPHGRVLPCHWYETSLSPAPPLEDALATCACPADALGGEGGGEGEGEGGMQAWAAWIPPLCGPCVTRLPAPALSSPPSSPAGLYTQGVVATRSCGDKLGSRAGRWDGAAYHL